jgi:hypothetical protein
LNSCFQPDNQTRALRNFVRQRKMIIQDMSRATLQMQKALEQMNIKLANVISDITGKTGMKIITEILNGERNPEILVQYRDRRIKASKETLLKSLEGNWREEQLFNLRIAYDHYYFLQSQLEMCDQESERILRQMVNPEVPEKEIKKVAPIKNQPNFNVAQHLYQALGTDVTQIYGLKSTTALTVFSETGSNLQEKFPTDKQFLSWLNLVPNNKITGGKVISSKVPQRKNRAGQAFKEAAHGLWNAQNPLGDYLRRKKARAGSSQAVVATAKRIASIYYKLVTSLEEFNPDILSNSTQDYLQRKLIRLENMINKTKSLLLDNQSIEDVVR